METWKRIPRKADVWENHLIPFLMSAICRTSTQGKGEVTWQEESWSPKNETPKQCCADIDGNRRGIPCERCPSLFRPAQRSTPRHVSSIRLIGHRSSRPYIPQSFQCYRSDRKGYDKAWYYSAVIDCYRLYVSCTLQPSA